MADVAFLSGLEESTISRLWDSPDWLDRVKGSSLQALIQAVPGVGEYVLGYSLAERRARLGEQLQGSGAEIDRAAFKRIVADRHIPEQYLCNALQAAGYVLAGDVKRAAAHLARFWGRDQDSALTLAYNTQPDNRLLIDSAPLVAASIDMLEQLSRRRNSFHAIVAQANLMHHVARATGETPEQIEPSKLERQSALAYRSAAMGKIIASNDIDLSRIYCKSVDNSPLAALIEAWAFPTFAHDVRPTSDFSLPNSLLLQRTADEILSEISNYNDAYLYYLASTSIPMILRRDPTFGLRLSDLNDALTRRMSTCAERLAREACGKLVLQIRAAGTKGTVTNIEDAW